MTPDNSKKFFIVLGLTVLLLPLSLETIVKAAQAQTRGSFDFCSWLDSPASALSQKVAHRQDRLTLRWQENQENLTLRRQRREQRLEQTRANQDELISNRLLKLEERPLSDEQKNAIVEFKRVLSEALSAKRTAIDQANYDFKNALDQAIADRKAFISQTRTIYRSNIQAALQKAKNSCASAGADPATIRTTLRAELGEAKNQYQSDVEKLEKLGEKVKSLQETRQASVLEAVNNFKSAVGEAIADLKSAFEEA